MGIIKPLDKNVYEKIAAGEVIDRPSAVLRELIDNSIDACPKNIKTLFEKGGLDLISVADDGSGMYFSDLGKAPLKHYTSKIYGFEDIYSIKTMGFRGEAISSISSVARLRITSYNGKDEHGGELSVEGGGEIHINPFVRKKGTTVEVRDLFYNVPARQKFTKSVNAEARSLKEVFLKKTLPFNNIAVSLLNGDKTVIDEPSQELITRIVSYYGGNFNEENLLEIKNNQYGHIKISGFVTAPQIYYHNRSYQFFYVNNRPVTIPPLYYAITSAYEGLMPGNKHAYSFIFIEIDPDKIDINIHPAKKEIKFFDERLIFSLVKNAITDSFKQGFPVTGLENFAFTTAETKGQGRGGITNITNTGETDISEEITYNSGLPQNMNTKSLFNKDAFNEQSKHITTVPSFISGDEKILGILFDTYLLIEKQNAFYIIDYHAAHERMNYEKLKSRFAANKATVEKQHLLTPITFKLSPGDSELITDNFDLFDKIGFEISEFGDNEFVVSTVPAFKTYGDDYNVIMKLVNKFLRSKDYNDVNFLLDELLKIQSCRMSIKAGDNPCPEHFAGFLDDLLKSGYDLTCPHGRPILIKMTEQELGKKFLRNE